MDRAKLVNSLTRHEGVRLVPYTDTTGHQTIGVGHNLSKPISHAAAEQILENDIDDAVAELARVLPWTTTLDDVRYRAFVELVFNMGFELLTFHDALAAAQINDWNQCAGEFANSLWHRQVGQRAVELEHMLATGTDPA